MCTSMVCTSLIIYKKKCLHKKERERDRKIEIKKDDTKRSIIISISFLCDYKGLG